MFSLLYDLTATQPSGIGKFHGGGTYAEIVFYALLKKYDNSNCKIYAAFDSGRYFNRELSVVAQKHGVELIDINSTPLSSIFKSHGISRFYSALLDANIDWPLGDVEVIVTIHGLRDLEMPFETIAYCYMGIKERIKTWLKVNVFQKYIKKRIRNRYGISFTGKMKIITVSKHSKSSILSFFPQMMAEDKIKVFSSPSFDSLKSYTPPPSCTYRFGIFTIFTSTWNQVA